MVCALSRFSAMTEVEKMHNKVQSLYDCQMSSKAKLLWCTHRAKEETALLFISKGDEQVNHPSHKGNGLVKAHS